MFGSEQGRQMHAGRLSQAFVDVLQLCIDRRRMCYQADAQTAQRRETLIG
jgi:hypothetical protein